ncbi:hypothetical protein [Nocardia vaccinii]|uniref:hypothetical protein n=1 Tax=Nocardia vaccinii TaxID=1822 RepID=UPI000833491B|nr:hypothetical protein [Nocardia vaccinii]
MYSEYDSPHWNEIVGHNWPAISPRDWRRLESAARDGAAAIDPQEAARARHVFEERVRASAGLQPIKDDMLAQQGTPQAFVDALVAAADTYGRIGGLVHRTRNSILDIVGDADRRIARIPPGSHSDDKQERQRVAGIIEQARRAVDDVVNRALAEIGPQGLPELSGISDALGEPGPWATGNSHPTGHSGYPQHQRPGPRWHYGPGEHGPIGFDIGWDGLRPPPGWGPLDLPGTTTDVPDQAPGSAAPREETTSGPETPAPQGDTPPVMSGPLVAGPAAVPPSPGVVPSGSQAADQGADTDGSVGDDESSTSVPPDSSAPQDYSPNDAKTHSSTADPTSTPHTATSDPGTIGTRASSPATEEPAADLVLPGVIMAMVEPPSAVLGSSVAPPSGTAIPPATGDRFRSPQIADSAAAQADGRVSGPPKGAVAGPASAAPHVSAPAGQSKPPARNRADDAATGPTGETGEHEAGSPAAGGSDELIRDAVGAALVAGSAPAFLLGERLDADLVLARSLLSSILAAADPQRMSPAWAVSIMRHAGGVSAFVTSDEGRGWIPAGTYLPREMSIPWVWSVSEGAAWEGLADPARILVEFALAWGAQSGARLSALASSAPIDADMLRQLGDLPAAGSVSAEPTMNFSAPATGLTDRLGLVGARKLQERVEAIDSDAIRDRCVDLAFDANTRVAQIGSDTSRSLGAPVLRERILDTVRQLRPVPPEWWEELRDADDLIAASMAALRTDVSRVALGQLRAETADARAASALRAMVFERRADELVLLLAAEPARQVLRDAVYAHGQLVDHPRFAQLAAAAARAAAVRRPTITAPPTR